MLATNYVVKRSVSFLICTLLQKIKKFQKSSPNIILALSDLCLPIIIVLCVCVCVRRVDLSSPLLHSKLEETTIHLSRMLQVREGVCASSSSSTSPFPLPPSLLPPSPYSFGPSLTLLPFSSLPSPLPTLTPSPLSFPFLPSPSLPLSGERHPPGAPPEQTQHHIYWNGVVLSPPP